jgi:hypothetical protein
MLSNVPACRHGAKRGNGGTFEKKALDLTIRLIALPSVVVTYVINSFLNILLFAKLEIILGN